MKTTKDLVSILYKSELTQGLDKEILAELAESLEPTHLTKDEVFINRGDQSDALYWVMIGCLRAKNWGAKSSKTMVSDIEPGDLVGEREFLSGLSRTQTVTAVENTELLKLPKPAFDRVAARYPILESQFVEKITQRKRRDNLNEALAILFKGRWARLAETIVNLMSWIEQKIINFSKVGNHPIHDKSQFPWANEVEKDWPLIRQELEQVLYRHQELPTFRDLISTVPDVEQWKTFILFGYGLASKENQKRCPETMRILKKIPGIKTALFSILSPGIHLPAHHGPYKGVLRFHLGLIIPQPRESCRIRIENEVYHWQEGEGVVFDDVFEHDAWNETDGIRVVLFVDFARPLRFPLNLLNGFLLRLAAFTPYMRQGKKNHQKWERLFYRS